MGTIELNVHKMLGREYTTDEAIEVCHEIDEHPPKVDFRLLWELHQEYPDLRTGELIGYLEMDDIPMTDAVRKLGICYGILYA